MPQSEGLHTCSRCGATVRTDDDRPPRGWIISVSWTSPAADPKRRDDLKRHEICPKHRDDVEREHLTRHGQYLEQEIGKYNVEARALGVVPGDPWHRVSASELKRIEEIRIQKGLGGAHA